MEQFDPVRVHVLIYAIDPDIIMEGYGEDLYWCFWELRSIIDARASGAALAEEEIWKDARTNGTILSPQDTRH